MSKFRNIAFVASEMKEAQGARQDLVARYGDTAPEQADVIVAFGGDGQMLQTMHRYMNNRIPIYGMNRGSVGFLLNDYREAELLERLGRARGLTLLAVAVEPVRGGHGRQLLAPRRPVQGAEWRGEPPPRNILV